MTQSWSIHGGEACQRNITLIRMRIGSTRARLSLCGCLRQVISLINNYNKPVFVKFTPLKTSI